MGMLPMIGEMIGSATAAAGWVVHLMISVGIGASFAVLLGWLAHGKTSSTVVGMMYGGLWWFLGPLTLMPLMMGMGLGVNWNAAAAFGMLPSLMGHLMFGTVLGIVYHSLLQRLARVRPTAARVDREAEATA
jgi:hypothetical protein